MTQIEVISIESKLKMEELFNQWLMLDNTQEWMVQISKEIKENKKDLHDVSLLPVPTPPPQSPKKTNSTRKLHSHSINHNNILNQSNNKININNESDSDIQSSTIVPRFYFPKKEKDSILEEINQIFLEYPDGIPVNDFVTTCQDICGFPSFFNTPLYERILLLYNNINKVTNTNETKDVSIVTNIFNSLEISRSMVSTEIQEKIITKDIFLKYYFDEIQPFDDHERFFRLLKQPENEYVTRTDFYPFLQELLQYHPGLEFLANQPEFQEKYMLTIIVRIFYNCDPYDEGIITLNSMKKNNILAAFHLIDNVEDINKVRPFFSYEHFYVLYCKFWELDTDHDLRLTKDDLYHYNNCALTNKIVERIFQHARRPFQYYKQKSSCAQNTGIEENNLLKDAQPYDRQFFLYQDFIYFMLSEEDKSNPTSLRYWFDLVDINHDNIIQSEEFLYFYQDQVQKMSQLSGDIVPQDDILTQMTDLLKPKNERHNEFVFSDFIKDDVIGLSGVFFNAMFNFTKFMLFEQRDPFIMRQQFAEPQLSEWDRFARVEYARLASEDADIDTEMGMDIDNTNAWFSQQGKGPVVSPEIENSYLDDQDNEKQVPADMLIL